MRVTLPKQVRFALLGLVSQIASCETETTAAPPMPESMPPRALLSAEAVS